MLRCIARSDPALSRAASRRPARPRLGLLEGMLGSAAPFPVVVDADEPLLPRILERAEA